MERNGYINRWWTTSYGKYNIYNGPPTKMYEKTIGMRNEILYEYIAYCYIINEHIITVLFIRDPDNVGRYMKKYE